MSHADSASDPVQPRALPGTGELDYLGLDSESRAIVQRCTFEIKTLTKRGSADTVKIGEYVFIAKGQIKYGKFGEWLEKEFDWSPKMAYRFLNVYNCFSSVKLSQLDIAPSALYSLAESVAPESARQEALQRAAQGEKITHRKALKIIDDHINPPIAPEVLLPEQRIASPQKQARPSSIIKVETSTVVSKNPESLESVAEARAIEEGTLPCLPLASEKIIEFRPSLKELKPENVKNAYSECKTGSGIERSPATLPLIQELRGNVDGTVLKHNPLQVFKLSAEGVSLRFEARAGELLSWLEEQSSVSAHGSVG